MYVFPGNVLFYTLCIVSTLALTNIGWRWPMLLESVKILENQLPDLRKRTNVIVTVVAVFVIVAGVGKVFLFRYELLTSASLGLF